MSLESSIFSALSDDASATAALVGSGSGCRVFPVQAPEGTEVPYVVFRPVASQSAGTHDASSDFDLTTIQFTCISSSYASSIALRKAVRSDLTDQTLSGGEKVVGFDETAGFSDSVEMWLSILDAKIWNLPLGA